MLSDQLLINGAEHGLDVPRHTRPSMAAQGHRLKRCCLNHRNSYGTRARCKLTRHGTPVRSVLTPLLSAHTHHT
jgi:hypothetical protein